MKENNQHRTAGRPPREGVPATYRITLRLTPDEWHTIEQAAADEERTASDYVRRATLAMATRPYE